MISILLPSRNRVNQLHRLTESVYDTAFVCDDVEIIVYTDDDDPQLEQYEKVDDIHLIQGPRITLSDSWNECWRNAVGNIFMLCGDDIIFRTNGWDEQVRAAFAEQRDRILFVHGDDGGGKGQDLGTHGFVHRNWTDTVGYFAPSCFASDYTDLWLQEVAERIGRRRYINILTEHMHPAFGKGEWDQTHNERIARHWAEKVDDIWQDTYLERVDAAGKLKRFIDQAAS